MMNTSTTTSLPLNKKSVKDSLLRCVCRENILSQDGEEIILKCRIVKILNGMAWAKCKRCGQWVLIPLRMA